MKKIFLLIFFTCLGLNLKAQESTNPETAQQIDAQVWEPFKKAYATKDGELYNSIHSDDVMRVTKQGILLGEAYKERNRKMFAVKGRPRRTIDFVFEHRIHSEEVAYEVGYYKLDYYKEDKVDKTYYGRFHVVLKKIDGVWKISQDWDTSNINGLEVTAKDFEKLMHK